MLFHSQRGNLCYVVYKLQVLILPNGRAKHFAPLYCVVDGREQRNYAEHKDRPVHQVGSWIGDWRETGDHLSASRSLQRVGTSTYSTSTVSGAVQASATKFTKRPHCPSENRSFGIGLPKKRRQISAAMQIVYENVMAMIVSDTIALKPTTGPKLMNDNAQVNTIDTQTALRGTSKSYTWIAWCQPSSS